MSTPRLSTPKSVSTFESIRVRPFVRTATFHYKTNAPNSNGPGGNGYFNTDPKNGFVGQLGSVHGATIASRT